MRAAYFTIMGAFLFVFLLGLYLDETKQPTPPTKWVENPKMKRSTPVKSANEGNKPLPATRTYQTSYDYEIDDIDTWNEFLEDIEMRGLEYTDPDAVEIWELDYK